ncbi:MAG: hypothetical protein ACR2L4_00685 [Actinomycetota bacterium]
MISWAPILERAAEIVGSYSTGVTLRQLYYRLVSEGLFANKQSNYKQLSARTAEARRDGWFPALIDNTRTVHRYQTWTGPGEAYDWLRDHYRLDRTEGQEYRVYIGVEKKGMVEQLMSWFGDLGIPVLALGGYGSQTYFDEIREEIEYRDEETVLLYAGDFDPSGEDILRDAIDRIGDFDKVVRVALTPDQVESYNLPEMLGKATDTRAGRFVATHGRLVQVELDALDPSDLKELYETELARFWDRSTYEAVLERERADLEVMTGGYEA